MESSVLSQQADRLIELTAKLLGGENERMLISLSQGEYGVLLVLSKNDAGVTSNSISQAMRIGPGGVANLLKALERKGYITKDISRDDRRANSVRITDAGRAALEGRLAQARESARRYLATIGPEAAVAFNDALDAFLSVSTGNTKK